MSTLAKSQAYYDAEKAYKEAVQNVENNSGPDRSAGPGYLRGLRVAVDGFKAHYGDVSTGESLLKNSGY